MMKNCAWHTYIEINTQICTRSGRFCLVFEACSIAGLTARRVDEGAWRKFSNIIRVLC